MVGGEPCGRLGQDQEYLGKEGHGSGAAAVPGWRGFSAPRPCAETEPVYLRMPLVVGHAVVYIRRHLLGDAAPLQTMLDSPGVRT